MRVPKKKPIWIKGGNQSAKQLSGDRELPQNKTTKTVYITGCLGFIGSYITYQCLAKGWYVNTHQIQVY